MFLIILIISIETLTMRVLITVPTKSGYGGVTNYYLGIKEYWKENIEYLCRKCKGKLVFVDETE